MTPPRTAIYHATAGTADVYALDPVPGLVEDETPAAADDLRMGAQQPFGDENWSESSVSRAAVRGVAWTGIRNWGSNVIALGVFVVLGRMLHPTAFGVVAAASVIIAFLRVIVDAGFSRSLVQRKEVTTEHLDTAFWTSMGFGAVFAVVTFLSAPLFAQLFRSPELAPVVRALSVIFIFAGLDSTQSALLDREMKFSLQAVRRLIAAVASACVAIGMAIAGLGVWALVGQQLVLEGTTVALLWTMTSWRPRFRFFAACWRELAAFGARFGAMRLLWYIGQNADNFLIGIFLGPLALGYYVIAYRVLIVLTDMLNGTVGSVALPTFSKLQDHPDTVNQAFYKATGFLAAVAVPIFGGLAVVGHRLLIVVFGAKWAPSVPVLEALTLAGVMQSLSWCISSYVIAVGLIRYEMWSVLAVVLAEIIGFAVAVSFGIVAVALALGLVLCAALPIRVLLLRRWRGIEITGFASRLPGVLAAGALMAACLFGVGIALRHVPEAPTLAVQIVTGALVYVVALRYLAPSLTAELLVAGRQLTG